MSPPYNSADPATGSVRLLTLGRAALIDAVTTAPLLGQGKPLAVLTYLALVPGRRASRETLLDLCWADLDPERGRPALRQALFHLRRLLGEGVIVGSEELHLAASLPNDRDDFLSAVSRNALDTAIQIYCGPFLTSFGVPGGAAFEQWADLERSRLEAAYLRAAELVVRRAMNERRLRDAREAADRARSLHPGHEATWRLVLQCALAGDDRLAATLEADAVEQLARADGRILEPATRALLAQVRQTPLTRDASSDRGELAADLTGRAREFAEIVAAWERVRSGSACHLHLSAPAGLGKSRLLHEVARRIQAGGEEPIVIAARAGDRDVPYAFLADLAAALARRPGAVGLAPESAAALVAVNPSLSSRWRVAPSVASGEEALRHRIHATLDLLQAVSEEAPLALFLDDAHWIDAQSYRVVESLCDRLGNLRCLCLTTARPERDLARADTITFPLPPLTVTETDALLASMGELPREEGWAVTFAAELHRTARGSPLLILQTLRLAIDEGVLALDQGEWRALDPGRLRGMLGEGGAMRQRIASLPAAPLAVLQALALSGTPVRSEDVAGDLELGTSEVAQHLALLERMGLVQRDADAWATSHDEVASVVRDLTAAEEARTLARRIGMRLTSGASDDPSRELRGLRQLWVSGDQALLATRFRTAARRARLRGDRRPFEAMAQDIVGASDDGRTMRTLVAAIPWHWRVGGWSPRRLMAMAAGVGIVLLGTVAAIRERALADAAAQALWYADAKGTTARVIPDLTRWGSTPMIAPEAAKASRLVATDQAMREWPPLTSPDTRATAWAVTVGGEATIDIWLRTAEGDRALTRRARDQIATDWTPDGRYLIGATNEWNSPDLGAYDIAVFDTATGAARQVTRGPDHDREAHASPDGTRIAFLREPVDGPAELCVVPFDGESPPECRVPGGEPVSGVHGWVSNTELLLTSVGDGTVPLYRYDWQSGARTRLLGPFALAPLLSPDRQWVIARGRIDGVRGIHDWLVPLDRPSAAKEVRNAPAERALPRWWYGRRPTAPLIEAVEFTDSNRALLLGVSRQLRIRALGEDAGDRPIYAPVRWRSSDTLLAVVDSLGVVRPRGSGRVVISASLAGWREVRDTFTIAGASATTLHEEQWTPSWSARWMIFGTPSPTVITHADGTRAFWNRGDGIFPSFGLLRSALDPASGLGVEVLLSTPLNQPQWLRARVSFLAGLDTTKLARSRQDGAPDGTADLPHHCSAAYPAGEGNFGHSRIAVSSVVGSHLGVERWLPGMSRGVWWRLRLQILPDGRCGVAVNGVPIWLSPEPISLSKRYWLMLGDQSAGSRLLHGPLTVWEGVRTDVDWAALGAPPPR